MIFGMPPDPDAWARRPDAAAPEAGAERDEEERERHRAPVAGPVLDTTHGWTRLQADPRTITYGRKSMDLDEVEWVSYWATVTTEKRFMFPTTYSSSWDFKIGTNPYHGGRRLAVHFFRGGRRDDSPEEWVFLVALVQRYLEPRLVDDMVTRVRAGETVTVGGSVKVSMAGIACAKPRFSVPWEEVGPVRARNGMVWVHRQGVRDPLLTVPLSHPNGGLIPALFAAFLP